MLTSEFRRKPTGVMDEARLSEQLKSFVRYAVPTAAILLPLAFFFSVLRPDATEPNGFIYLAYVGALLVSAGFLTLGVGILRSLKV